MIQRTVLWVGVGWIHGRAQREGHNAGRLALGECGVVRKECFEDHLDGWTRLGSERRGPLRNM